MHAKPPLHANMPQVGPLLKQYQEGIDQLTRRAKHAEGSFLALYGALYEAPDPAAALLAAAGSEAHAAGLEAALARCEAELREYQAESKAIKNQDLTIRKQVGVMDVGGLTPADTHGRAVRYPLGCAEV